jgi:hypothetical protein
MGKDVQVLPCMHSLQRMRYYMLFGSRLFPYLATKKKSLFFSISGEPVCFVSIGDHMHARQWSLWWLRSQVSFVGKSRASCRSRSLMVHLGTIDVMLAWTVEGYIDTHFFSQFDAPTYANITKGNCLEQISDVTTPEAGEVAKLRAKVKGLEDLIQQMTADNPSHVRAPSTQPREVLPPPTTGTMVDNEITKRMEDIESRMQSELVLRMDNSIQKAMRAMMEQMRLEQQGNT